MIEVARGCRWRIWSTPVAETAAGVNARRCPPFRRAVSLAGDGGVDGIALAALPRQARESHALDLHVAEYAPEPVAELRIGRIVRPQAEDTVLTEVTSHPHQPIYGIECRVVRVQQLSGRMVDVEQDGAHLASGPAGVEAGFGAGQLEEVAVDEAAAGVGSEASPQWQQPRPVPLDDFRHAADHLQRPRPWMFERRLGGVAQAEPADHDAPLRRPATLETDPRQRDLRGSEPARHQVFVTEDDLVDVVAAAEIAAPAQAQGSERRYAVVEFLEHPAHGAPPDMAAPGSYCARSARSR